LLFIITVNTSMRNVRCTVSCLFPTWCLCTCHQILFSLK